MSIDAAVVMRWLQGCVRDQLGADEMKSAESIRQVQKQMSTEMDLSSWNSAKMQTQPFQPCIRFQKLKRSVEKAGKGV